MKLTDLVIPPWLRLAFFGGVAAVLFGGGMWSMRAIDSGKIEKLRGEKSVLEYEVKDRDQTIRGLVEAAEARAAELAANHKAMVDAQQTLQDELAKPPRVVVRFREAAAAIPDAIESDKPCTTQVHQAMSALQAALRAGRAR